MLNDFSYLFPVVIAGTAMIMDLRTAKVDNGWILFSMFVGFVLCIRDRGVSGIRFFLMGSGAPLFLAVLFVLGMLGAGDIKLIAALSTIMGADLALAVIIYSLFIGAIIGIARWILKGQFLYRLQSMRYEMYDVLLYKQNSAYFTETNKKEKLHFTICIMGAVIICIMKEGME